MLASNLVWIVFGLLAQMEVKFLLLGNEDLCLLIVKWLQPEVIGGKLTLARKRGGSGGTSVAWSVGAHRRENGEG